VSIGGWEDLSWPAWARGATPLFRSLFEQCFGNYRVHISDDGEKRIEVTLVLTPKNIAWVTEVAKKIKPA
jgi:hypothetical protein